MGETCVHEHTSICKTGGGAEVETCLDCGKQIRIGPMPWLDDEPTPPQQGRELIDDLEGIANSITLDHDGLLTNHAVKIHEAVAELERLCAIEAEATAFLEAWADGGDDERMAPLAIKLGRALNLDTTRGA